MVTRGAEAFDAELVGRALDGDRAAFFARSMTGSPAMAEDVTQEVFIVLMRDLARYDPQRAALGTYLYSVARNVTRARLRRDHRFVSLDEVGDESEPVDPDDPSVALTQSQELMRLRKAIVALPSRYREVVVLCDLHELSYAEAAEVIDVPIGTVRSRLHRGRTLLIEGLHSPEAASRAAGRVARCLA